MAEFTLTIYADDDETPLLEVGTASGHAAPYLHVPSEFEESSVDLLRGGMVIGQYNLRIIDPQTGATQAVRWLTSQLGTAEGHSALARRRAVYRRVSPDSVVIMDGVVGRIALSESFAGYHVDIKDVRERGRKVHVWDRTPMDDGIQTTVLPRGTVAGYGAMAGGDYLIPATEPLTAEVTVSGGTTVVFAVEDGPTNVPDRPYVDPRLVVTDAMLEATAPQAVEAGGVTWLVNRDVEVWWRSSSADDWKKLRESQSLGLLGEEQMIQHYPARVQTDGEDVDVEAVGFIRHIHFTDTADFPADGSTVQVMVVYAGEPTEDYPWRYEGDWGTFSRNIARGDYSPQDPRLRIEVAAYLAIDTPVRVEISEPRDDLREVLEELHHQIGAAPALTADGEMTPIRHTLPTTVAGLTVLDDDNCRPIPGWEHDPAEAVTAVEVTYHRDVRIPPEDDLDGARAGGDTVAAKPVTVRRTAPESVLSVMGDEVHEIDAWAFRSLGGDSGRPVTGALSDEMGFRLAMAAKDRLLDRFVFGGTRSACETTASPSVGEWILDRRSWRPNLRSGERGGSTLAQVVSIRQLNEAWVAVELSDAAPEDSPLLPPALGPLAITTANTLTVPVTALPAGIALVEYAVNGVEPAEGSPLFQWGGERSTVGDVEIPLMPPDRTVWVRARARNPGRLASEWINGGSIATNAAFHIRRLRLTVDDDGSADLEWEVTAAVGGLRIEWVVHPRGEDAPAFTDSADVDPDSQAYPWAAGTVPAGYAITADVTPYEDYSAGSVSGTAGPSVRATASRAPDLTGPEGPPGPQGDQGEPGPEGTSSYFHIAYADDAAGNGFSQDPAGKAYLGTYVDEDPTDSNDPADYAWQKVEGSQGPEGDQGIQGPPGPNGETTYLHIAYANSADGTVDFTTGHPNDHKYIGTYTDFTASDSANPADYDWNKVEGPPGKKPTVEASVYRMTLLEASVAIRGSTGATEGTTEAVEYQTRIDAGNEEDAPTIEGAWSAWTPWPSGHEATVNVGRLPFFDRWLKARVRDADGTESEVASARVKPQQRSVDRLKGRVFQVLRGPVDDEPTTELFKKGFDTAGDVIETGTRSYIAPSYVDGSRRVDTVRHSSIDRDASTLFRSGVDTLAGVLDSPTHRRTTIAEADQATEPSQNLLGPDAGPEQGSSSSGLPKDYTFTLAELALNPSEPVSLSADLRSNSGSQVRLQLFWLLADGSTEAEAYTNVSSSTYQRAKINGATPSANTHSVRVRVWVTGSSNGFARRMMFNRGPLALPFEDPPFRANRETAEDVAETPLRNFVFHDAIDPGRRIVNVKRGATDAEPVDNLFKNLDPADQVGETGTRSFIAPAYVDASRRVNTVRHSSEDRPANDLFRSGIDTADSVLESATKKWAAESGAEVTTGKSLTVLADRVATNIDPTAGRTFIAPSYVDASLRVDTVRHSSVDRDASTLFRSGVDTLAGVLDSPTHRRTTIAEADQATEPSQNLLGPDAGPEQGSSSSGLPKDYTFTLAELALNPSEPVSLSADLRSNSGSQVRLQLFWLLADGSTEAEAYTNVSSSTYQRAKINGATPSANTHSVRVRVWVTGSSNGFARRMMFNRGPLALPFEDPPFRIRRERLEEVQGNLREGATQSDGVAQRVLAKGHVAGSGWKDGNQITFPQAFQSPPMILLRGGLTYHSDLGAGVNQIRDVVPDQVTAQGFILRAKILSRGGVSPKTNNFNAGFVSQPPDQVQCPISPGGAAGGAYTVNGVASVDSSGGDGVWMEVAIETFDGADWVERSRMSWITSQGESFTNQPWSRQINVSSTVTHIRIICVHRQDFGTAPQSASVDPSNVTYDVSTDDERSATPPGVSVSFEAMAVDT